MSAATGEEQRPAVAPGPTRRDRHSPFLPILLLAIAILGTEVFQTAVFIYGRGSLQEVIAGQDVQMEQSKQVRAALASLVTRTARLAKAGNANATLIVEQLRKRGVTINPDAQPSSAADEP